MRLCAAFVYVILCFSWMGVSAAPVGQRIALVIGNANYNHVGALSNPLNDSVAIAKMLSDAGFSVVSTRQNLSLVNFKRALADFQEKAAQSDVAIIYYSGHGLEVSGQNYLVPVDAELKREVDVADETVPLSRVLSAVAGAKRLKLIILDACRNDPFSMSSRKRTISRGLARVEPDDSNELIAYSAKAGTVADDGKEGGNSPYTSALLANLTTPGVDIEMSLRRVRTAVMRATFGQQEPFVSSSIGDEFPLVEKPQTVSLPTAIAPPPPPPLINKSPLELAPGSASVDNSNKEQATLEVPARQRPEVQRQPPASQLPKITLPLGHVHPTRLHNTVSSQPAPKVKTSHRPQGDDLHSNKRVALSVTHSKKCFVFNGSNYCQ